MGEHRLSRRMAFLLVPALVVAALVVVSPLGAAKQTTYTVTPLVSDQPGVAPVTDPDLVNPWGLISGPTTPWWVSDNGTNKSTLYRGDGVKQGLVVTVAGGPTGTTFNSTASGFQLPTGGKALFLFDSEDGKVRAWNGAQGTTAIVVADRSNVHAIYKGLSLAATPAGPRLYAADFHNQRIDVFDGAFGLVPNSGFDDPALPKRGFSPFNVQVIGSRVFVAYAKLDSAGEDELAGQGRGFVDVYDLAGNLLGGIDGHGQLNAPWGLEMASAGFGTFAGDLLVGQLRRRADQRVPRGLARAVRPRRQAARRRQPAARDRRALGPAGRPGREQRDCRHALLHRRPRRGDARAVREDHARLAAARGGALAAAPPLPPLRSDRPRAQSRVGAGDVPRPLAGGGRARSGPARSPRVDGDLRTRRSAASARSRPLRPAGRCRADPRRAGSTIIGLPKWIDSVTVLLPPWVITRSTSGQDRRLRQELGARHVGRELDLVVLRALADDVAVGRLGQRGDEAVHQLDVGRAEAAEADVDERAFARRRLARLVDRAHAGVEALPALAERSATARSRPRRDRGRGSGTATRGRTRAPGSGGAPRSSQNAENSRCKRLVQLAVALAELVPAGAVGGRVAGEGRRQAPGPSARAGCRRRSAPRAGPNASTAGKPTTLSCTITSGSSSPKISAQALVYVARAVDELLPDGQDEGLELLDRRLAELRRGVADEVLPELARRLLDLRRGLEAHQRLLEALRLERAGERLLDDEDDALRRARAGPGRSRRSCWSGRTRPRERRRSVLKPSACSRSAQSSSTSSRPTLRRNSPGGTRSPSQRVRLSSTDSTPPRLVAFLIFRSEVSTLRAASPSATSNERRPPKPG